MPYVYLIYNQVNGKLYVGKGSSTSRWNEHLKTARGGKEKYPDKFSVIHAAINKYGPPNFVFKIVEYTETDQDALDLERAWISFLRGEKYILYNLTDGGDGSIGFKHSDETKNNLSEMNSGPNHPQYGKPRSDVVKDKISASKTGTKRPTRSKEWTNKITAHNIGNRYNAKLTEDIVREIKTLLLQGVSQASIAKQFNITPQCVYDIKHEDRKSVV